MTRLSDLLHLLVDGHGTLKSRINEAGSNPFTASNENVQFKFELTA